MYRYSRKCYNDLLLNLGGIRVGTLHDFRRSELGAGISDPEEGKKRVYHHIENLHIADSEEPAIQSEIDVRALSAFRAVKLENSKDITFSNITVSRPFDHPDCFLLCTSEICASRMLREFDGAETCIRITDIPGFYRELTRTLNITVGPVAFMGVRRVRYGTRNEAWNGQNWGNNPALLKATIFEPQAELRALWVPRSGRPIQPTNLINYRLTAYCEKAPL